MKMKTKQELMKATSKYTFKNEVQDNKVVLTLSGPIARASILADETINSKDVVEALDGIDKDVLIRLNSPGGDAFQGIEIYNYLKNHPSHITVEVTALAASAASIIAMAADELIMSKGASLMIHEAKTVAIGNKADIKKTLSSLENVDESIIEIYQDKTGLDENEIRNLMTAETWFTAKSAVEKGFADKTKDMVETPEETKGNMKNESEMIAMRNEIEGLKIQLADFKNNKNQPKKKRYL